MAVSHPVDLRRVAEWAGTSVAAIHELNPELRRQTTPKDSAYELKVPVGTSAEIARHLNDELTDIQLAPESYYTVKRGDTLPVIARKLRVSRADLAEANDLASNARLTAGQRLVIPGDAVPPRPPAARPAVSPVSSTSSGSKVKSEYRVRQGDTLTSIAELYETSVKTLQSWNPQLADSRIVVGQRLTVYRIQ